MELALMSSLMVAESVIMVHLAAVSVYDMECVHPILVKNIKALEHGLLNGETSHVYVPCGKCVACRINKTREWTARMLMESFDTDDMMFLTLTYDNEHIPDDFGLHRRDVQLFLKRLRRDLDNRKIRYYFCGEYGDTLGRPHYHAIIYNLSPIRDRQVVIDNWHFGFVYFGSVTPASIGYVAKYVQKKLNGVVAVETYDGRESPFSLMSQGIGKGFMSKYSQMLKEDGYFQYFGKRYPLPRYFKDRYLSRVDKYNRMIDNPNKVVNPCDSKYPLLERRLITRLNMYADPKDRIYLDPDWYIKEF